MTYNRHTAIPTEGLVYKADLDGWVPSWSTASNVTWVWADRWYVEEVGSFNWINSSVVIPWNFDQSTYSYSFNFEYNSISWPDIIFGYDWNNLTKWLKYVYVDDSNNLNIQQWNVLFSINITPWKTYTLIIVCNNYDCEVFLDNVSVWTFTGNSDKSSNPTTATLNIWTNRINSANFFNWKVWNIKFYNKALSQDEISSLYSEGLRRLGPTNAPLSGSFPKYSLPNLEEGKVLEISRPQSGWSYIDQTGNWNNWTPTSVTDSTNGLYNVMSFNGTSSIIDTWTQILSWLTNASVFTNVSADSFSNNGQAYIWEYNQSWDRTFALDTVNSNNFRLIISDSSNSRIILTTTSWDYQVNKFYKVWFTYDNWDVRMYIDGVEVLNDTTSLSWPLDTTTENFVIWARDNDGTEHFDWDVSSVEVWNRTLSDTEIQKLYYSSKLI